MTEQVSMEATFAAAEIDDGFVAAATGERSTPPKQSVLSDGVKRFNDVVLAVAIGAVLSPVIVACWMAIQAGGGGAIFSQLRVGRNGQMFRVFKFRTMVPNAKQMLEQLLEENPELKAEYARDHKLKNDPRVTRVGRFLRSTSLDELPQLWNVLRGEMSLVGPRPVESFEMAKYGYHAGYYYSQKPGLTGLWQISGRSDVSYRRRVAMDIYYSKNRNIVLDFYIVLRTVLVVLFRRGAY